MRRTVNEARAPSPRLRMSTPSKTWSRSFSPSMTFTCTRTVSPGAKPCRSFFSAPASTSRIASMACPLSDVGDGLAPFESLHESLLVRAQLGMPQQVGPTAPRPPQRLRATPPRDARVIARQQHGGHALAAKLFRPRVLRRLQQSARERLALGGALGAEGP